ncbi:membrane associated rhomboid family serine protease [Hasllibacter halocynthiae]|uniref:Membrane associated rhomboid family serine protease n=1 Tax=Hasllibacter halocynthiae TaxID=595589 RepID=A0A2T0X681_9RHOB|nr:rhomboid family intramembrane serine protease [Hasllibacter halocynthiae]PRY94462.1 membrane associated rhomboid family serine protease [Hasllibacter halocynthiae]
MFPIRDHNPSEGTPFVTWALIALNVVVFLGYVPRLGDPVLLMAFWQDWALVPREVTGGEGYGTILTSMFLHGGWLHLGGNMLFLWIFGDNLEAEFGHLGFLAFYLFAGAAAGLAQVASAPLSPVPMVGASGAIAGVMGGYLLLFPKARVDVLFIIVVIVRIIPLPAWIVLGAWFAIQVGSGAMTPTAGGGVAYWAHTGGFAAGLAMTVPLFLRRGGTAFWARTDGHPPHPPAKEGRAGGPVAARMTGLPRVPRRGRRPKGPWDR